MRARDVKPPSPDRRTVVTRGAAWTGTVAVAGTLIQVGVIAVLARLLTPAEFGVVSAAALLVALMYTMSLSNVIPLIIRNPTLSEETQRAASTFCIALGMLFFLLLQLLASQIEAALKIPGTENAIRVLAFIFPVRSLGVVSEAISMRQLEFRRLAVREFLSYSVGYAAVAVCLAVLGAGYWAIIAAQLAQVALSTFLILLIVPLKCGSRGLWSSLRSLLRSSSGYSAAMFLLHLATIADNFIVGRALGPTALGLYGRAYQLMAFPSIIFGKVSQSVLFPAFARVDRGTNALAQAYRRSIEITALAGLPLTALLLLLADDVVLFLLGKAWIAMVPAFQILALTLYFRLAQKASQALMRSIGTLRQELALHSGYLIGIVIGSVAGVSYGITGVAVGVCLVTALHSIVQGFLVCRLVRLSYKSALFAHGAPLLSTALVIAVLWLVGELIPDDTSSTLHLFTSVTAALLAIAAASYFAPRHFLGEASTYIVDGLLAKSKRHT